MITAEKAALKLSQAQQSIRHACGLIEEALGEVDAGMDYECSIAQLIADLEDEIEAIQSGEVYEFKE